MKINIKKTIIPNQTYEPGRKYLLYNEIEHKLAYGVGAWMSENNFDEIEANYNGDFNPFMDEHLDDLFWPELKRRAGLFFDEEFIGWISIDKKIIHISTPCELYLIDHIISHKKLIDFRSSIPVEIIMYFESIKDSVEEKDWCYDQNPYGYELI